MHAKHIVMQQRPGQDGSGMRNDMGDIDPALFELCSDFMGSIWRDDQAEYDMWEKENGWEGKDGGPNNKLPQEKSQRGGGGKPAADGQGQQKDIEEMTTEDIIDLYFKCKSLYDKKKGSSMKTIEDVWGHMFERWFEE